MDLLGFKNLLSSLNQIIYFDRDDFLREKASDPTRLLEVIKTAEALLEKTDENEDKYFLMGTLGNLYRIQGNTKEAMNLLTNCLDYALVQGNFKKEIISSIRLGEAFKYDGKHTKANQLFDESITKCKAYKHGSYLDFALQHKGKCLLEMGNLTVAKDCLDEALRIRKLKGDEELIQSTQLAIKLLKELQKPRSLYEK